MPMEAPVLNDIKLEELRALIRQSLVPLINNDYVLLDLPYYENPGDTLIWEGTLNFLGELPWKMRYATGKDNYRKPHVGKGTVVLLQGGGNWGDLWPEHQRFRERVIREFPDNPVVVLPQSVHYDDTENLRRDAAFLKDYPNVVICLRDKHSFEILSDVVPNRLLLVPDMAFFVDARKYADEVEEGDGTLYLRRVDKEAPPRLCKEIPADADVHDWPTIERWPQELHDGLRRKLRRCRKIKRWTGIDLSGKSIDRYWHDVMRPAYLRSGIGFISRYSIIYSTRLHVTILGMLLGKKVHVLDNSYGKTKNLLDTWL